MIFNISVLNTRLPTNNIFVILAFETIYVCRNLCYWRSLSLRLCTEKTLIRQVRCTKQGSWAPWSLIFEQWFDLFATSFVVT